jgi:hypothetical protein
VDGDGAYLQEFIEAATPGSIAIDPFSILQVSFDGVRSKAVSTIYNIPLIDTSRHEAMFQMNFTNISALLYRNGAISTYGAQQIRQTCIYFKPFFRQFLLLPTKILSFTAKPAGKFNWLEWSATNEDDMQYYIVQKSADGQTWSDIQVIKPGSLAAINNYTVTDTEKNSGDIYYRLKQIDMREKVTYSKVVRLSKVHPAAIGITHNTVITNTLNLQIYGITNEEYTAECYTTTGLNIKKNRFKIHPGINQASVQFTSQTSSGLYVLVIKNNKGQQIYTSRVVKK